MSKYSIDRITKRFGDYLDVNDRTIIARAPGRINLIGEHTDYNKGLVLPAAIDKYMYFGLTPNGTNIINAFALDFEDRQFIDIDDLTKTNVDWLDFIIGILLEFKRKNVSLIGFDCILMSEVPIGSGMSSSSALECAVLTALNHLFRTHLDKWELINMSQSSNHNFMGVQGGILDQFSSLFGKAEQVMSLDCASLDYQYINIPDSEFTWLLINTCVKHSHLTSGYNDRVAECQTALQNIQTEFPSIKNLSEVKNLGNLDTVKFEHEVNKLRAAFIVKENARVEAFKLAIEQSDFETCGSLLYDSHLGLKDEYQVSCPELDFLVDALRSNENVLGSRMMGGGFGGCTINLIKQDAFESISQLVKDVYFEAWNIVPEFYMVKASDGASVIMPSSNP